MKGHTANTDLSLHITEKLDRAEILARTEKAGEFRIGWAWQTRGTHRVCDELVRKGKLRRVRRSHGVTIYELASNGGGRKMPLEMMEIYRA